MTLTVNASAAHTPTKSHAHDTWQPALPVNVAAVFAMLSRGNSDPCVQSDAHGAFWRATRTPEGPATTRFRETACGIEMHAWGPGAAWAIEHGPELLGAHDVLDGFAPTGKIGEWHRRHAGLRMPRTRAVYEAAVRAVCEQLVTGIEAARSYRELAWRWGEPAPGPFPLRLPPTPATLAALPYYDLHPVGIEQKRSIALRHAAKYAARLEETTAMPLADAYARVRAIPGLGVWSAAEIAAVAWGDADAVSVGDYHLKNTVVFAFTGRARGSDDEMLELLEPYRPHRARVVRLLHAAGIHAPRFGPRHRLRRF